MIAVISPHYRPARAWLEIDHGARMTGPNTGTLPDGREFQIFVQSRQLRGKRGITAYWEYCPENTTQRERVNFLEMRILVQRAIALSGGKL